MRLLPQDPQKISRHGDFTLFIVFGREISLGRYAEHGLTEIDVTPGKVSKFILTEAPYTATLLVIRGTSTPPASEWDLNPDTVMRAASGTVTLAPKLTSGNSTVTLSAPQSDSGITVNITDATVSAQQPGAVTITAGANPGFYHYTLTGTDASGVRKSRVAGFWWEILPRL